MRDSRCLGAFFSFFPEKQCVKEVLPNQTKPLLDLIGAFDLCWCAVCQLSRSMDDDAQEADLHDRALAVWSLLHGLVSILDAGPLTGKLAHEASADLAARSAMKLALA